MRCCSVSVMMFSSPVAPSTWYRCMNLLGFTRIELDSRTSRGVFSTRLRMQHESRTCSSGSFNNMTSSTSSKSSDWSGLHGISQQEIRRLSPWGSLGVGEQLQIFWLGSSASMVMLYSTTHTKGQCWAAAISPISLSDSNAACMAKISRIPIPYVGPLATAAWWMRSSGSKSMNDLNLRLVKRFMHAVLVCSGELSLFPLLPSALVAVLLLLYPPAWLDHCASNGVALHHGQGFTATLGRCETRPFACESVPVPAATNAIHSK